MESRIFVAACEIFQLWHLGFSSLTGDQTQAAYIGSSKSSPRTSREIPYMLILKCYKLISSSALVRILTKPVLMKDTLVDWGGGGYITVIVLWCWPGMGLA